MKFIPFLDLNPIHEELNKDLRAAFDRVLHSGSYILGPEVEDFEQEYADYCNVAHCVGVGNGLDALCLGLKALGVSPGDEVIVPSHTFIATWLAVTACGAIPVPVEPAKGAYNINAAAVADAITPRTRVVIPVHLYGQPVDLDPILQVAKENGIMVLEDAAQAHGARYKGKRIGGHGDCVAWSFYPGKNLGALGDGGAVTTSDPEIAERLRLLRNYGSTKKYLHQIEGANSRLDPLQAAILRVKLKHLDRWNDERASIAEVYRQRLSPISPQRLSINEETNWSNPVWHLFVIETDDRDWLQTRLTDFGIGSLVHYPTPPHLQPAYAKLGWAKDSFPRAEQLSRRVLSLPIYPGMAAEKTHYVADTVIRCFSG